MSDAARYVVTGASGALGRALLERLPGQRVLACVRGGDVPPGVGASVRIDVVSAD